MNDSQSLRKSITEDSFAIAPEMLGLPLARPARRAAAMGVDLLLIVILIHAGGVLFGVAAAWVFFRISGRSAGGGVLRRSWRFAFRSVAAVVLFATVVSLWSGSWRRPHPSRDERAAHTVSGVEELAVAGDLLTLRSAGTEAERRAVAQQIASRLREQGLEAGEIREVLESVSDDGGAPWVHEVSSATARNAASGPGTETPEADSLLRSYAAALSVRDSAAVAQLRPALVQALAGDTVAVLQARMRRMARARDEMKAELTDAQERTGILAFLRASAEDLGLGFGWSGLYFTAFLALWGGQTPGKRLMRIRVQRLDGQPMTWWAAFERFGGYAASIFTGLLGFVQILWDRNRQGMHDKICETVVIRLQD